MALSVDSDEKDRIEWKLLKLNFLLGVSTLRIEDDDLSPIIDSTRTVHMLTQVNG